MTLYDYSEFVLSFINKVDTMWNHFFAANAAIIVWLASVENEIPLSYRVFATIIYCSYIFMKLIAHLRAYKFLNLALIEFRLNISDMKIKASEIPKNIENLKYDNRHYLVISSYSTIALFMNFILWSDAYRAL